MKYTNKKINERARQILDLVKFDYDEFLSPEVVNEESNHFREGKITWEACFYWGKDLIGRTSMAFLVIDDDTGLPLHFSYYMTTPPREYEILSATKFKDKATGEIYTLE
ncbi:MAG: hypothetical protein SFW35_03960 [Chitinophagales bacterium]|nr:hypothetical protein [Chitinophagales bacterium]